MHRRFPVIYILLLGLLVGAYYYLDQRTQSTEGDIADIAITLAPEEEIAYLFASADGMPTNIRMESSQTGEVVELARNAENVWELILPVKAAAEQGSSEAVASQLTTIRISDRLPTIHPKDVGLDEPQYKLTVKFTTGVERIAEIGVITPTETGYYVRADNEIVVVSRSAIDTLLGLLTNPPYAETPTPLPPTPEAGAATSEAATPTP